MVDLSGYDGAVNFDVLASQGVALVAAKCTEFGPGGQRFVDPDYLRNRKGAYSIGARFMPYALGTRPYRPPNRGSFSRPTPASPRGICTASILR